MFQRSFYHQSNFLNSVTYHFSKYRNRARINSSKFKFSATTMILSSSIFLIGICFQLFSLYKIEITTFVLLQNFNMILIPLYSMYIHKRKPFRYIFNSITVRHTYYGIFCAIIGSIIIILSLLVKRENYPVSQLVIPLLIFILGTIFKTLGLVLYEEIFQNYEFSEIRFYCLESLICLLVLSIFIYPLISLINCQYFNSYMSNLCPHMHIDHPIFSFNDIFKYGNSFLTSPQMILCMIGFIIFFNVSSITRIKLSKSVSVQQKSFLENLKIILFFILEIFLFNLKDMQEYKLDITTFLNRSLLKCLGYIFYSVATVLIFELYPVKIFGLSKNFGRYYLQNDLDDKYDGFEDFSSHYDSILQSSSFMTYSEIK